MKINESPYLVKNIPEAREIQRNLKKKRCFKNKLNGEISFVAGCDVGYLKKSGRAKAAIAVFSYPELKKVEIKTYSKSAGELFPYVPTLLAFREMPLIAGALEKVKTPVDVIIADGHGFMHPRGMGLAVHLGIATGIPAIGCAKNYLCGRESEVVNIRGAYSFVFSESSGKIIGATVRTRKDVKPLYVSAGWGITLDRSIEIVMECAVKYRQSEVIRQAHREANLC